MKKASNLRRFRNFIKRAIGKLKLRMIGGEPSVIVMVDGGLCSVMTKIVYAIYIHSKWGVKVKFDLEWFVENGVDCDNKHSRSLNISNVFPKVELISATRDEISFYKKYFYYKNQKPYMFNKDLIKNKAPIYIDGYCENWKYFHEVEKKVLDLFSFDSLILDEANQNMLNEIRSSSSSIAVHVRRGDYVNLGLCSLSPSYYLAAIKKILSVDEYSDAKIFFFSDDINWVELNILPEIEFSNECVLVNINGNDSGHLDLLLISSCQHQVASNSSFGYWGGLLNRNPNKMVVLPSQWIPNPKNIPVLEGNESAHSYPGFILQPSST